MVIKVEKIRRTEENDVNEINKLLYVVQEVYHRVRPNLFKGNTKKYTDLELKEIIKDDTKLVFVYEDDKQIKGYAFCIIKEEVSHILTNIKTIYYIIDDLCVEESSRRNHIGTKLYSFTLEYAKRIGCYNLTLNVWADNKDALKLYEKIGLHSQKIAMERILD